MGNEIFPVWGPNFLKPLMRKRFYFLKEFLKLLQDLVSKSLEAEQIDIGRSLLTRKVCSNRRFYQG